MPTHQLSADALVRTARLPELSLALALLAQGQKDGLWKIVPSENEDPESGTLQVVGAQTARVFLLASADAALKFKLDEHLTNDDRDAVLVYGGSLSTKVRSPHRASRHGKPPARRVSVSEILADSSNGKELMEAFLFLTAL